MKTWQHKAVEVIVFLLLVLFVYTATSKLFNLAAFEYAISQSPILQNHSTAIAWMVPATELLISLLLVYPFSRKAGLLGSFLLLLAFTLYTGWMLLFSSKLPCSCGGVINWMSWEVHLVFNMVFTLLALWGWIMEKERKSFTRAPGKHPLYSTLYSNKPPAGGRQELPKTWNRVGAQKNKI